MHAAVEHVEVRHRQGRCNSVGGQPPPQRHTLRGGQRACEGHGHADQCVRAEPALVRGPIEIDHGLVGFIEPGPRPPAQQAGQLGVDRSDRTEHTFAPVAGRITVAAFHGLPRPGRGARRHPRPGDRPVTEPHRHGQRGPPARVQDLQRRQLCDVKARHRLLLRADRCGPAAWPGRSRRRGRGHPLSPLSRPAPPGIRAKGPGSARADRCTCGLRGCAAWTVFVAAAEAGDAAAAAGRRRDARGAASVPA